MNQNHTPRSRSADDRSLLDIDGVAKLLNCSRRHVMRLSRSPAMPPPIRLGKLLRWSRTTLDEWIASGCPRSCETRAREIQP